jgi:diguanylate cyclase (GGDEF)-like protein/PAS domain S-box-containing protein
MQLGPAVAAGANARPRPRPSAPTGGNLEPGLGSLLAMVSDLVLVVGADGRIEAANSAWRVLGWEAEELVGRTLHELTHPEDRPVIAALARGDRGMLERMARWTHGHGGWHWLLWTIRTEGGRTYAVAKDVTERRALERRAFTDELTGLANRALVLDRLRGSLARLGRSQGIRVAVLFVDLDGFKQINDGYGHHEGDRILKEVAGRLRAIVRAGEVVGRFGGDEFVVVTESLKHERESTTLAERIIDAVGRRHVLLSGIPHRLSCSVGIAMTTNPDADAKALLSQADMAMYRAKSAGPSRIEIFDSSLSGELCDRLQVAKDLRTALIGGRLSVHYQPVVTLADTRVSSVEALVRWNHPERGWLAPARFLPLAEMTGLIVPLGRHVLQHACRQAAAWRRQGVPMTVSINISRRQLLEPHFEAAVRSALAAAELPGEALCLELTDPAPVAEGTAVVQALRALRAVGVKVALDDFGARYTAFSLLAEMPIDAIKIDRRFTAEVTSDSSLVRALVGVARELEIAVIAEGVETKAQLAALRQIGCTFGQGHLFAQATPAEDVLDDRRED